MMSSRLWVASRARSIRDHSQTESRRPFLFTFPFETLKSCCVLGCFSGADRDRTISFHRLPPKNRPRLTKVLHNLRTKRVCGASTSSVWGKALWMCQVFSPFSKQRQPRPISNSKRRGLEPDGWRDRCRRKLTIRTSTCTYTPLMELIDQLLSSATVAESMNLSKTPVAVQDGVTDKCNPVFLLQGQLEMKLVSICWTKLRSWQSDCWKRWKLSWSWGRS